MTTRFCASMRNGSVVQVCLGAGLLLFLRVVSIPLQPQFVLCGFQRLTGHLCPLCGMTRALSLLLHGEWSLALQFNLLSPVMLALLGGMLIEGLAEMSGFRPTWRVAPAAVRGRLWTGVVALFVVYGVVRFFHGVA
jgi:hypothetical protein